MEHFQITKMVRIHKHIHVIELNFIDLPNKAALTLCQPILVHFIKLMMQPEPLIPYLQYCENKFLNVCPFVKKNEYTDQLFDMNVWEYTYVLQIKPKLVSSSTQTDSRTLSSEVIVATDEVGTSNEPDHIPSSDNVPSSGSTLPSSRSFSEFLNADDIDLDALEISRNNSNTANSGEHAIVNSSPQTRVIDKESEPENELSSEPKDDSEQTNSTPSSTHLDQHSQTEINNAMNTTLDLTPEGDLNYTLIAIQKYESGELRVETRPPEREYKERKYKYSSESTNLADSEITEQANADRIPPGETIPVTSPATSLSDVSFGTPPENASDLPMSSQEFGSPQQFHDLCSQDTHQAFQDLFKIEDHEKCEHDSTDSKENKSENLEDGCNLCQEFEKKTPSKRKGLRRPIEQSPRKKQR